MTNTDAIETAEDTNQLYVEESTAKVGECGAPSWLLWAPYTVILLQCYGVAIW